MASQAGFSDYLPIGDMQGIWQLTIINSPGRWAFWICTHGLRREQKALINNLNMVPCWLASKGVYSLGMAPKRAFYQSLRGSAHKWSNKVFSNWKNRSARLSLFWGILSITPDSGLFLRAITTFKVNGMCRMRFLWSWCSTNSSWRVFQALPSITRSLVKPCRGAMQAHSMKAGGIALSAKCRLFSIKQYAWQV